MPSPGVGWDELLGVILDLIYEPVATLTAGPTEKSRPVERRRKCQHVQKQAADVGAPE
jgi:hypothetical protein